MRDLEGTAPLLRLALRRDRVLVPAWIAALVFMVVTSAGAVRGLYPTLASRVEAANAVNGSSALVAMFGRIYDPTSLGSIAMVKMVAFGGAAVAILAAMITIRHTRAEEEAGRFELLGATVLGRRAPLTAALLVAVLTSVAAGLLASIGLIAFGLPAAGSVAFGATWVVTGAAFAGVGAVAAQVSRTSRGANGLAVGFVGLSYLVRALGDTRDRLSWLTWVSPLGWVHQVRAFGGNQWSVLLLLAGFGVGCGTVAYALAARRDLGAGLFTDHPGPGAAGPYLRGTVGLAWRLERTALAAWMASFSVLGAVVGGVAGDVGSFLNSNASQELIRQLGGQKGIIDAYLAAELGIVGLVIAAYGVHAALRLSTEEANQRTEVVLSTGVSRTRWISSYLFVALVGTALLAVTVGISAGLARAQSTGDLGDLTDVLSGAIIQLPAVWVLVAIVAAAYGIGPRLASFGWVALVFFVLLGVLGPMLKLPDGAINASPFTHTPKLPGAAVGVAPLAALLAIAMTLTAAGIVGFRRRDLT